jgi:hypothetical protein
LVRRSLFCGAPTFFSASGKSEEEAREADKNVGAPTFETVGVEGVADAHGTARGGQKKEKSALANRGDDA